MGILILNGSPKMGDGASRRIGLALKAEIGKLPGAGEVTIVDSGGLAPEGLVGALRGSRAFVLAMPLYVDGLPSHLIDLLEGVGGNFPGLPFYAVINCGFWESDKNLTCVETLRNFCLESGLRWGQALAWGGGGMIPMAPPLGRWPLRGFLRELGILAGNVVGGASGPERFAVPDLPRFLYKVGANLNWYRLAMKNGVRFGDLRRRLDG
ncbi:MAG: NAD(P)H-dependent oxidoreductase [Deltaproteobacteria bacterium]|jgi:hypothetical protein|nr:NAD(P)H-dependent oxidoreductase [Deltaproteobacteria bacterium]